MTAPKICEQCAAEIEPYSEFPGSSKSTFLCLPCYTPIGDALARTMTAQDLARMWGGK